MLDGRLSMRYYVPRESNPPTDDSGAGSDNGGSNEGLSVGNGGGGGGVRMGSEIDPGCISAAIRPQLGAHLDGNMFTLLWASSPGLQVAINIRNQLHQRIHVA